jgi:YesN/AraC family two-component response regulator
VQGVDVINRWRQSGRDVPVLILTARASWTEKVEGLNAGADDYITKPCHIQEIAARLRALIRRSAGRRRVGRRYHRGERQDLCRQSPPPHTNQIHVVERFKPIEGGNGAFNMPWSGLQQWRRLTDRPMVENLCAENNVDFFGYDAHPIPQAVTPDF